LFQAPISPLSNPSVNATESVRAETEDVAGALTVLVGTVVGVAVDSGAVVGAGASDVDVGVLVAGSGARVADGVPVAGSEVLVAGSEVLVADGVLGDASGVAPRRRGCGTETLNARSTARNPETRSSRLVIDFPLLIGRVTVPDALLVHARLPRA